MPRRAPSLPPPFASLLLLDAPPPGSTAGRPVRSLTRHLRPAAAPADDELRAILGEGGRVISAICAIA